MTTLNEKLDTILINLKVISKLNVSDRPLFSGKFVQIRGYWPYITPIIRTISGESRDDILFGLNDLQTEIDRLYNDFISQIEFYNPQSTLCDKSFSSDCIMRLIRLKLEIPKIYDTNQKGLNALMITYETTPETISQIENIIANFQIFHRKLDLKINELCTKYNLNPTDII